jgi:8-oxo-dGTP pyrophosphatase MutT (NUDIX family)
VSTEPDILSCGAVIVRRADTGWLTLMLRAYRNWDFPKGLREDGETPLEAAIREVGEETGIHELSFDWGEKYIETGPYNRGKVARYYLARTDEQKIVMGIVPELGRAEHHQGLWMDFDQAYDLTAPRVRGVVQWARQIVGA